MVDTKEACKVFIIDDELDVRERLGNMLKRRGYSILTACDGVEGFQKVVMGKVDIIICDIFMPNMNGIEFLARIQGINLKSEVIIITAYPSYELSQDIYDKGVTDILIKPFTVGDMVNSLTKAQQRILERKA